LTDHAPAIGALHINLTGDHFGFELGGIFPIIVSARNFRNRFGGVAIAADIQLDDAAVVLQLGITLPQFLQLGIL
jgi:hypothetical protein